MVTGLGGSGHAWTESGHPGRPPSSNRRPRCPGVAGTILLTGFEPFARERFNPTGVIARGLNGRRIGGMGVKGVQLPVVVDAAGRRLRGLLDSVVPGAVLATGVAPGRGAVSVERVAVNVLDFDVPDNRGRRYRDRPIRRDGPAAYFSRLPVRRILQSLHRHGVPTELSNSAGTYLCNFAMYTVLDSLALAGRRIPAGFVHVPQTPEASVGRRGLPSMDLAVTRRAIEVVLREIAATRRPQRR